MAKIRVSCNGCFDGLHPGHLFFLGYSLAQGDELVVGLNSDEYIRRRKRSRPHFNEQERERMLMSSGIVSRVVVFHEDDPREFIANVCPQVHCTGAEYVDKCVEAALCRDMSIRLVLVPRAGVWSTSLFGEAYAAFLRGDAGIAQ